MNLISRAAVAILAFALCSSCIKKPALEEMDSGVAAEALDVQKAIALAWGSADPAALLRKSDFSYLVTELTVQGNNPTVTAEEGITVSERNRAVTSDNQKIIHHKILRQLREYKSDGSSNLSTTSEDFDVTDTLPQQNSLEAMALSKETQDSFLMKVKSEDEDDTVHQRDLSIDIASYLFNVCALQTPDNMKIQCYNLVTSSEVRPAPSLVAAQTNCGGLPDCQMHVFNVNFDVLVTTTENDQTTTQKIKYHFAASPDVPYFSRVLDFCTSGLVKVPSGNQTVPVLVKTCNYVRNFNYGIPDTNL